MATGKSGYFDISGSAGVVLRIHWSEDYDISTNQSTVSITNIQASYTSYYYEVPYYFDGSISVNGAMVATFSSFTGGYYVFPYAKNTFYSVVVGSGYAALPFKSAAIVHNSDGSKSTTISVDITGQSISNGNWKAAGSSTVALATIPRASSMTVANGTLGTAQTIKVSRADTSFTHTITYTCGTATGTICTKSSSTSISFTPPVSLASQNVSATSVSVTFELQTYSGSTAIGSAVSTTVYMAVPSSVVPTVSLAVSDAKGYLSTYGGYIQNKSQAKVTQTSAGVYGSSIKSCTITCGSLSVNATSGTFDLPTSGTITVKVTVTDTRGRSASASTTITVIAYAAPTIQITAFYRCNSSGTATYDGTYAYAIFNAAITSLSSKNTASYAFKYRVKGTSTWTSISLSSISGNYAPTGISQKFAADNTKSYEICIAATDAFGTVESQYRTISPSMPLLDVSRADNAMGLGSRASKTNTLSVGFYTEFLAGTNLCNYGHNLLDNSYFPQVINQAVNAAAVVKTTTAGSRCLDRYIAYRSGIALSTDNDGLHMSYSATSTVFIYQKLAQGKKLNGKTVTVAVCDGDGNIACASTTLPSSNATSWTSIVTAYANGTVYANVTDLGDGSDYPLVVRVGRKAGVSGDVVIKWAALYEGKYTIDTLPTYIPKGYAAELMECQRYYYVLPASTCLSGHITSSKRQIITNIVPQLLQMRIVPTATLNGTIVIRTTTGYSTATGFTTSSGGNANLLSSYSVGSNGRSIILNFDTDAATEDNTPVTLIFNSGIIFSADL